MAFTTALEAEEVGRAVQSFATATIRKAFPNLEQSMLERITSKNVAAMCQEIVEQHLAMEASKARKNLLDLPPEIRNRIYDYAFTLSRARPRTVELRQPATWPSEKTPAHHDLLNTLGWYGEPAWNRPRYNTSRPKEVDPICRASSQLRRETLPMYYASTTFILHISIQESDHEPQPLSIEKWLSAIGKDCVKLIKNLQVIIARIHFGVESQSYNSEKILQALGTRKYGIPDERVNIRIAERKTSD